MKINTLINNRRSIRSFKPNLISKKDLDELINAFKNSPSSCNLQLSKLILIDNVSLLKKFEKHVTGKVSWTSQIFVLIVNNKINFENHAQYISLGMAVQNLILKAEELGIGTCPIAGFENKTFIKKNLNIPNNYDIPLLLFFGYKFNNSTKNFHIPYKTSDLLSKNKFNFNFSFPDVSNLLMWKKSDIIEYRKRIMSVYYPRLSHGIWRNSLNHEYKLFLNSNKNNSKLIYFMWERNFFNLNKYIENSYLVDYDLDYLDFMKVNHKYNFKKLGEKSDKKFDSVLIANTLEFQTDLKEIFKDIKNNLNGNGTVIVFNYYGLFSLVFSILRTSGILKNVYHNSPFYKIGPYRFIKLIEIKKLLKENNLYIQRISYLKTNLLSDKIKNKYFNFLFKIINILFPENIKIEFSSKK